MKINIYIVIYLLIFMIFSLSTIFSIGKTDQFIKQIIFWIVSFFILFSSFYINYSNMIRYPYFYILYIFSLFILFLTLIFPTKENIWFNIGGFYIQPSEFTRIIFLLTLTLFISKNVDYLKNNFFLFISFLIISPFIFFIGLQPDLGMILLYILTWIIIVINFISLRQILILFLIFSILSLFAWHFILKDYQKLRIITFLNPDIDPLKYGYNSKQLKITIGSAGFWGKGFGNSTQAKLGFLPAAETDFILASFIEERGILGFLIYSLVFLLLLKTLIFESNFIKDPLGQVFANILVIHLAVKFLLTSAINLSLFPIVGLAVPFLSYGGSHLISDFILLSIWHNFRYS